MLYLITHSDFCITHISSDEERKNEFFLFLHGELNKSLYVLLILVYTVKFIISFLDGVFRQTENKSEAALVSSE